MNLSPQEVGAELTLRNISVKWIKSILNNPDSGSTNTSHVDLCEAARVNVRTPFVITVVRNITSLVFLCKTASLNNQIHNSQ